jgi:hypothetical protein
MPVVRVLKEPSVQDIALIRQISSLIWNKTLPEKLIVIELANILLALHGSQIFINALGTAFH